MRLGIILAPWGLSLLITLKCGNKFRGQDRSSAAKVGAANIIRGSAAKLKHLARELFICCCVRIENFSNA